MALAFALKSRLVREADLVELNDIYGPFYVTRGGSTPELRQGFFYADERHQFFFYAEDFQRGEQWFIDVHDIVSADKVGPIVVPSDDAQYLEHNICHLFTTRFFYDLKKEMPENIYVVTFSWRVGK